MNSENKKKPCVFLIAVLSIILFFITGNFSSLFAAPPAVILSSYSITANSLTNEVITLHLVLTNTSKNLDIHDILISYTSTNDLFLPAYGDSNQFFIPRIPAGSDVDYDLLISVSKAVPNEGEYEGLYFNFHAMYSDWVNGVSSNEFFISDIIKKENAIQLLGIDATDINILGTDEIIISYKATVLNYSNSLLKDVFLVLEGKAPSFTISLPLDDMSPGQHLINEFHLTLPSVEITEFTAKFNYIDIKGVRYYSAPQRITVYLNNLLSDITIHQNKERSIFRVVGLVISLILLMLWAFILFIKLRKKSFFANLFFNKSN